MTVQAIHYDTTRLIWIHITMVEFSGRLHLWWIPLLTPELCVTSVSMNQFASPQG